MRPTYCLPERSEGKTKVIKQQHLPLAVLKRCNPIHRVFTIYKVATTPTACGIETKCFCSLWRGQFWVATTPTACGIETY